MGFEPILSAWKAEMLPITPIPHMARAEGFEPPLTVLETAVLPLHQARMVGGPIYNHQRTSVLLSKRSLVSQNIELITSLAQSTGFEPASLFGANCFQDSSLTARTLCKLMGGITGFEPARLSTLEPQSSESTNFSTFHIWRSESELH